MPLLTNPADAAVLELPCLTVRQPWSWAIIFGGKDIENRTWRTRYRGEIAIHAARADSACGMQSDLVGAARARNARSSAGGRTWQHLGRGPGYEHSAILGTVTILDAHRAERGCCRSKWAEYRYYDSQQRLRADVTHWVLGTPRPIPPLPHSGTLGLRPLPAAIAAQVLALRSYQDGDDVRWFERTGHCGGCGLPGGYCECTPDQPCGCRHLHPLGSAADADALDRFATVGTVGQQSGLFDLAGPALL